MRTVVVAEQGFARAAEALRRSPIAVDPGVEATVRAIVEDVRARGDEALIELGRRFDSPDLAGVAVSEEEWSAGAERTPADLRTTIELAAENIVSFHRHQLRTTWMHAEEGRITGQLIRALDHVGVYVPGGTACYASTVLMCAAPAAVAGVPQITICTPCARDGGVPPAVLYAARIAGVRRICKVGGAQAIAAMAFGTASVPAVDKIVGPGNLYVATAKRLLWGAVDMDMIAGPSEVCVVADETASPAFAAADMLTQAEHDPDCAAVLITTSAALADQVRVEIEAQMARLPRREILRRALDENGVIVVAESLDQAIRLADECAPEHLALMVAEPFALLGSIKNAGAILIGGYSPQTLGDYWAGPSHTLPTGGAARFSSPLHVDTFLKKSSFISYSPAALAAAAPHLERFAEAEGLHAHAEAVRIRVGRAKAEPAGPTGAIDP